MNYSGVRLAMRLFLFAPEEEWRRRPFLKEPRNTARDCFSPIGVHHQARSEQIIGEKAAIIRPIFRGISEWSHHLLPD
jgi:hypothetical protein